MIAASARDSPEKGAGKVKFSASLFKASVAAGTDLSNFCLESAMLFRLAVSFRRKRCILSL
ncbi:hypothetical protein BQ8794_240322 [Mesorhizobium prunaredense]|uniref:Uncharacterized protein n=1 Tax=Mesorhizobium prunaredense TaxID=1631249 RepID=A0A1R3V8C3_9HYPH|nr:hypothetical protein BQ8794_240322 [Mesorhizobium prunaredense]